MANEMDEPVARLRIRFGNATAVASIEWKAGQRLATLSYGEGATDLDELKAKYYAAVEAIPKIDDDEGAIVCLSTELVARDVAVERMPLWDQYIRVEVDEQSATSLTQTLEIPGATTTSKRTQRNLALRMKRVISGVHFGSTSAMRKALDEGDADAFMRAVPRHLESDDAAEFEALIAEALSRPTWEARSKEIRLVACDALLRVGRVVPARKLVEVAAKLEGGDVDTNFNVALAIGNCYAAQRNFDSATLTYESALERWPRARALDRAWGFHNLGSVFFDTARPDEGRRAYGEAARLRASAGKTLEPAKTLARAAHRLEQFNAFSALSQYDEALSQLVASKPLRDTSAFVQLQGHLEFARGRLLFEECGQPQRALTAFNAAVNLLRPILEEADAVASLHAWQAHCHSSLGDDAAAAAILGERSIFVADAGDLASARVEEVLAGNAPTVGSKREELAALYAEASRLFDLDLPEALGLLERIVELDEAGRDRDPALQALVLGLGAAALWKARKQAEAISWQRRATAILPGSVAQRSKLAAFLLSAGRYAECSVEANRLVTDFPGVPHGHLYAGLSAHRGGEYVETIKRLEAAKALGAASVDVDTVLEDARMQLVKEPGAATVAVLSAQKLVADAPPVTHKQFLELLRHAARRIERNSDVFWRSRKEREFKERPEGIAKALLMQDLSRDPACRMYNEMQVSGGRLDLTVNVYGTEYLLELKMCGGGYARTYAEGGFEQMDAYMKERGATRGYLLVFDGRVTQSGTVAIPSEVGLEDGRRIFGIGCNVLGLDAK